MDCLHVHANGGGDAAFTASHAAATDYFEKKKQIEYGMTVQEHHDTFQDVLIACRKEK